MIGGLLNYLDDAARSHGLCFYPRLDPFRVVKDCVACRAPLPNDESVQGWSWLAKQI